MAENKKNSPARRHPEATGLLELYNKPAAAEATGAHGDRRRSLSQVMKDFEIACARGN